MINHYAILAYRLRRRPLYCTGAWAQYRLREGLALARHFNR